MKTVLFAVDRLTPDQKALDYSLTLCRRMLAKLDVLHILTSPAGPQGGVQRLRSSVRMIRDAFEDAMVKAAFAEAGVADPESALKAAAYDRFKRMLPEKQDAPVSYQCVVTAQESDTIIERYVLGHPSVVLMVLDSPSPPARSGAAKKGDKNLRSSVMPRLTIPIVLVKDAV
jgi:hypothetical protein